MSLFQRLRELAARKPVSVSPADYRKAIARRNSILGSRQYRDKPSRFQDELVKLTNTIHDSGHVDKLKGKYGFDSKTLSVLNYVLDIVNGNGMFSTGKGEKSANVGKQLTAIRKKLPKAYLESPPVCYRGVGKLRIELMKQLMEGEMHLEQRSIEHWTTNLWNAQFFAIRSGGYTRDRFAIVYKKRIPASAVLLNCIAASRDLDRKTGESQYEEIITTSGDELSTVKLSDCVEIYIPGAWITELSLPKPKWKWQMYSNHLHYIKKGNSWEPVDNRPPR